MNQAELIEAISSHPGNTGTSKIAIKFVLTALADVAAAQMVIGDEMPLPGIGKLSIKHVAARKCSNPKTGDTVHVPAKYKPHFSAAMLLKDAALNH